MKRIAIRVITNSHTNIIEEGEGMLKVRVTAPAVDGKANKAVIEALASYFGIRKSSIRIIRGEKSRDKIIEMDF